MKFGILIIGFVEGKNAVCFTLANRNAISVYNKYVTYLMLKLGMGFWNDHFTKASLDTQCSQIGMLDVYKNNMNKGRILIKGFAQKIKTGKSL